SNAPEWLFARWRETYGEETARKIDTRHTVEPALDLSVKSDAKGWAEKFGGIMLPTGTVRFISHGTVPALAGYDEGEWWVQDATAALPARLLGDIRNSNVADLCAAPGGKTAQLVVAGANVTAVDRSGPRLERLRTNLERLKLKADVVQADAVEWT